MDLLISQGMSMKWNELVLSKIRTQFPNSLS